MYVLQTSVLLISLLLVSTNSVWSAQSGSNDSKTNSKASSSGVGPNALQPSPRAGPMIDRPASKNVTALLGKTAYLNCKVKNLGNKTVSWVRHRDIHLLTVGRYTYTSDQRFRAIHHQSSEDWSLQIKYPQHRDTGIYECQISTTPHMSHFIHLNVVEPTTDIIGGPDLYIDRGSTINLTCVVLYSPEPPAYIFWNHNEAIISYDSPRGGVSVITEKGETTTSFLLIQRAKPTDSGRYQCNPSNAQSKSINVHVLNGDTYQQPFYPQDEVESPESEENEPQYEKTLELLNEMKELHRRIDQWEVNFERIDRMEEEISNFSLRLAKLESIHMGNEADYSEIAEHRNDSDCYDCVTETTEWSTEGPEDTGSTDYPDDVTTDTSNETTSTEMIGSTTYELIDFATDFIEHTSEGAENDDESSGSGEGTDEQSDADSESPQNSGNGAKFSVILMFLASLMAQFPAAMQHGGQAHHRSSHLYCLIFCVCLLLFST